MRAVGPFLGTGEVRLTDDEVGVAIDGGVARPAQHPVIAGVGDQQHILIPGDVVRPAEAGRPGVAAAVLRVRRRVRLAQDDVGGLVRVGNPIAPAENPAVSGVGDPKRRTDHGDTERPIHARRRAPAAAVGLDRNEVGLADDDVGCGVAGLRHGVPHQDAVMPSVRNDQPTVMDEHPGR